MKKTLIALSLFAFIGSAAVAGYTYTQNDTAAEIVEGGKDKKKKKKCDKDCAKECCTADAKEAKSSCTKGEKKACCAKKK